MFATVVKPLTPQGQTVVMLDDEKTVLHVQPTHLKAINQLPEMVAPVVKAPKVSQNLQPKVVLSNAPSSVRRRQGHLLTSSLPRRIFNNFVGEQLTRSEGSASNEDTLFAFVDKATPIGTNVKIHESGLHGRVVGKEGHDIIVSVDGHGDRRVGFTQIELDNDFVSAPSSE